jgi:streptogramin lyase
LRRLYNPGTLTSEIAGSPKANGRMDPRFGGMRYRDGGEGPGVEAMSRRRWTRSLWAAPLVGLTCLVCSSQAAAACPPMQICFPPITELTGGVTSGFTANMAPKGITAGPNGSVWFTETADPGAVAEVTSHIQLGRRVFTVTEFTGGVTSGFTADRSPNQITLGPDGNIWFTEGPSNISNPGAVARLNPDGTVTEFTGGVTSGFSAGASPESITTGPDGNLWFTEPTLGFQQCGASGWCGGVARINLHTVPITVTQFEAGHVAGFTPHGFPQDITTGPNGKLWFSEPNLLRNGSPCGGVGQIDPSSGAVTQLAACSQSPFIPNPKPWGISPDAAGHVWFAEQSWGVAYAFHGAVTQVISSGSSGFTANSQPTGIGLGSDMNMWFSETANPGALARVNPDGSVTELVGGTDSGLSANGQPGEVTQGPGGNIWFAEGANPGRVGWVSLVPLSVAGLDHDGGPSAGGNTVTITGPGVPKGTEGGFLPGMQVKFGSAPSPTVTYVSPTELQAVAPSGSGVVHVTVGSTSGWSQPTNADLYAYGPPAVSAVHPDGGSTAGGGTVRITGTGFVPGATVMFGSTAASTVTFVNKSTLTAAAPPESSGVVDVTVTTGGGTSTTGNADLYAYGVPTVSNVSPSTGPDAGGDTVTITGTGFVPGATVTFGTTQASTVSFVSPTELQAVAPPGATGTVAVRVHTAAGLSPVSPADRYTYSG